MKKPLSKKTNIIGKFKSAIKRGTGEAHLLMKDNPQINFSNEIIKAALKNLSYDNQCESRDEYVFELIGLSAQKENVMQKIFQVLASDKSGESDFYHLCNLVARFAKEGVEEARKAIYKKYYSDPFGFCQNCDEEIIVNLDGMEGLMRIAETQGKTLQENAESHVSHWTATGLQERETNINVYEELASAAKSNHYIKTYYDAILEDKQKRPELNREKYSYESITEKIGKYRTVRVAEKWKKEVSKRDIRKLADDMLKQTDRKQIATYLSIFQTIKWPYDYKVILDYTHFESMQNKKWGSKKWDMLVGRACGALKFFSGTDIRELALEKFKDVRIPYEYTPLLVKNYKKGDAKILVDTILRCKNDTELHSMAVGIIEIYEKNKRKECRQPLEMLYEKTNCGLCRKKIVAILTNTKTISDKIKNEIQFDSNEEIRNMGKIL